MKQPFRFQGTEVYPDIRSQTPRSVPDADAKTLDSYEQHMDQLFGGRQLPPVLYKGRSYPARKLGEFIELAD